MKWKYLSVLAWVVAVGMSSALAQERTWLQFEVSIDGSIVARPEMRVPSGGEGRLELGEVHGEERVIFTPTFRGDDVAIAFDISSGGRPFRPTLVITKTVPGSLEWTSSTRAQTIRLTVSLVQ
jgi:hypothetical protein